MLEILRGVVSLALVVDVANQELKFLSVLL
jgi:hypothetical protein